MKGHSSIRNKIIHATFRKQSWKLSIDRNINKLHLTKTQLEWFKTSMILYKLKPKTDIINTVSEKCYSSLIQHKAFC